MYEFYGSFDGIGIVCGIEDGAVVRLGFGERAFAPDAPEWAALLWERVKGELAEYFAGERRGFDLPLRYEGTQFQRSVWEELLRIPYGETRSYGRIAALIGRPGASRAVGMACHLNPICVLIPCHRVVSSSGALTGFAEGLEIKARLLETEGIRVSEGQRIVTGDNLP